MTTIRFDPVADGDRHPLNREGVQALLSRVYAEAPDLEERVGAIRFGCNRRTTQEGRMVWRGTKCEIRINFCPRDGNSRLLGETDWWLKAIKLCGGRVNLDDKQVQWDEKAAGKYAAFLLLHELAHVGYFLRNATSSLNRWKASREEERYCEEWAALMLGRFCRD